MFFLVTLILFVLIVGGIAVIHFLTEIHDLLLSLTAVILLADNPKFNKWSAAIFEEVLNEE